MKIITKLQFQFIQAAGDETEIIYFQRAMQLQRVDCKLVGLPDMHSVPGAIGAIVPP